MNEVKPKYWDNASTTFCKKEVVEAMLPYFNKVFGNASSQHILGKKAKAGVDAARTKVANLINADANQVYFTSGSTESINWLLKGYVLNPKNNCNHIITARTEHKAVLETCEYLEELGIEVSYVDLDENGVVIEESLLKCLSEDYKSLVCLMHVNNETGVIQDIKRLVEISKSNNPVFFSDGTQAAGKIEVDVEDLGVDFYCYSSHKIHGPKGVGMLYQKQQGNLIPLLHGGSQEKGERAGTYNTAGIVGFGAAAEIANNELTEKFNKAIAQKENIINQLNVKELFTKANKSPYILSVEVEEDEQEYLMKNTRNFIASTGSACNASLMEKSHVLKELKLYSNIVRFSL